jgi:hypothetical protein
MSVIIFLLKAMGYGIGLAGGFWLCGMATRYIEYYLIPLIDGRWDEIAGPKTSDAGKTFGQQFDDEWFMKPFKEQAQMFTRLKNIINSLDR